MKAVAMFLAVVIAIIALAVPTQVSKNDPHGVQPILDTLAEIDLANQILPLTLTKDQVKELLPKIEECRQNVRNQEKKEADKLKTIRDEAEKVLKDCEKGSVPTPEFLKKVEGMFTDFYNQRNGVKLANVIIMYQAMDKILHDGQKKIIISTVDRYYEDEVKTWENKTDELKMQFYALHIFLSDSGYQFLTKLNRNL